MLYCDIDNYVYQVDTIKWKAAESWPRNRQYTEVFRGVACGEATLLFLFLGFYATIAKTKYILLSTMIISHYTINNPVKVLFHTYI